MGQQDVLEVLRRTTLFARFNEEQLEVVPKVGRTRTYQPGDVIVRAGSEGAESMWVLLEGEVEIRVGGEPVGVFGPGKHFGELALLTDAPRSADVVAIGDVRALEFSRAHLRGLIHSDPEVAFAVLGELATRLRDLTELTAEMIEASPEAERIAHARGVARQPDEGPRHLGPIEYALRRLPEV
jgi:CRP-like cAMP-binding protein